MAGDTAENVLPWLRRAAIHLAGDSDLADDLVQETLIKANLGGVPPDGARGWFASVMRNAFRSELRSDNRRRRREREVAFDASTIPEPATADEQIAAAIALQSLRAALLALPPKNLMVVRRYYFDGDSFEQIARSEALSPRTVRRYNDQAIVQLRRSLREFLPDTVAQRRAKSAAVLPWFFHDSWFDRLARKLRRRLVPLLAIAAPVALVLSVHAEHPQKPRLGKWQAEAHALPRLVTPRDVSDEPISPPDHAIASPIALNTALSACGSLQALVDAAAPGSVLQVPSCIYRESVVIHKPLTLRAAAGAELRGSDPWYDFALLEASEGQPSRWLSRSAVPPTPRQNRKGASCGPQSVGPCADAEQVFLDGEPLQRMSRPEEVGEGQFALDGERRLVLGSNPDAHEVQVSVRTRWITINANDVTVSGFKMQHAANLGIDGGALLVAPGWRGVTIQDNALFHSSGVALVTHGAGHQVKGNTIANAGWEAMQITYTTQANDVLVSGNNVYHNGGLLGLFRSRWVNAGITLIGAAATVTDNHIHDNRGMGILIVVSAGPVVRNNRIENNAGAGIASTASEGAQIRGNTVSGNGNGAQPPEPGMMFVRTQDFGVHDNEVSGATHGIFVGPAISPGVPESDGCLWSRHNALYRNRIVAPDEATAIVLGADTMATCPSNRAVGNILLAARLP